MAEASSALAAPSYHTHVELARPPEVVFDALTTLSGLAGWWSPVTGTGAAGGVLRFDHVHNGPVLIAVDVANRPHSVVWTVLEYELDPEWVGTRITFELGPNGSGETQLAFRHDGLTPQVACYDRCSRGWDYFLASLRDFVETGTGTPLTRPGAGNEGDSMTRIEQDILIDAPVDVVWQTITEPDQIRRWFADRLDLEITPGYDGSMTFDDNATHQPVHVRVCVQDVAAARSYSYRWQHPDGADAVEGNSTLVEFTLTPERDGTRLRVVESGMERMPWSPEEHDTFVEEHTSGWAHHLGRLQEAAESAVGSRADS
jgi:uncharacterized protein YndB with AHSA1/START domain